MTIACSLSAADLNARRAAFAHLIPRDRQPIPAGIRLAYDPAQHDEWQRLIELEARCCPFLTFALHADQASVEVTGPAEARAVIAALFD